VQRRDFLRLGVGGMLGLSFVDLLAERAQAATAARAVGKTSPSDVNCILIWMDGGPSHFETFDPKPDAPVDIRGELNPIPTAIPGVHFCESMPKLAKAANKLTVIRSICHKDPFHGGGNHYMNTGMDPPVPVFCGASLSFHPSYGSVVSSQRGVRNGVPAYMCTPWVPRSGGPNFLGARHAPFVIGDSPNDKGFKVRDVVLPSNVTSGRELNRMALRHSLDRLSRMADNAADDPAAGFDANYQQAMNLVSSAKAQAAFDIAQESDAVRDAYGRNDFGQRLLLSRRLVEAGVSFVTCGYGGWDHHTGVFAALKGPQGQTLDQGIAALVSDLDQRGMLDSTMVLCFGEFGRTPKVNATAGRDHWPYAMSVLAAGAGMPRGYVLGSTDAKGYYAHDDVHSPEDLASTIYSKMGIDPAQYLQGGSGRPVQLVTDGQPIKELFT
jgi:hypothetical protein